MTPLGTQLIAAADKCIERALKTQRDAQAGQHGLFGIFDETPAHSHAADALPNVPDFDENQRLQAEKEVLGFFVSGHPLDRYAEKLRNLPGVMDTAAALESKPAPQTFRRGQAPEPDTAVAGVAAAPPVSVSPAVAVAFAAFGPLNTFCTLIVRSDSTITRA